jgi:predicted amidohydrolase
MMSSVSLRSLLLKALSLVPRVSRLAFHALLDRWTSERAGAVRQAWREPAWDAWKAEVERQIELILEESDWAQRLVQQIGWIREGEAERLLIFAAVLLRCLDRYHRHRARQVGGATVDLPSELGGGCTLFLPPPASPIADQIPARQRLVRRTGDLRNHAKEVLDLWWHVVPLDQRAIEPRFGRLPAPLSSELEKRLPNLRIGLASPCAKLDYLIHGDVARCGVEGSPYRFAELSSGSIAQARAEIEAILSGCAEHEIDVLCFPELTLDPALLFHLQRLLKTKNSSLHPALIVAGSFHVPAGEGWVNRCQVLDGFGNVLFVQDKCVWYRLPAEQATPAFCGCLGIDERGGHEDIALCREIQILDSPLGRLATPICIDFCGDELRGLLVEAHVNLLLVPAMTPEMRPFRERAWDLGTQSRAATFVANSAWLHQQLGRTSEESGDLFLAYLPTSRPPAEVRKELAGTLVVCSIRELLGLP